MMMDNSPSLDPLLNYRTRTAREWCWNEENGPQARVESPVYK